MVKGTVRFKQNFVGANHDSILSFRVAAISMSVKFIDNARWTLITVPCLYEKSYSQNAWKEDNI